MIHRFGDERTELIFDEIAVKRPSAELQHKAFNRLRYIDQAERIEDLRTPPSNRLERKKGNLKEFYAIWVNTQWRIIFRWDNGAHDVQLIDYH